MVIKIQSISDVITNSSTEVFVVYDSTNINSIKRIVDSILAIDSSYTFDDLFTIKMIVSEHAIYKMYANGGLSVSNPTFFVPIV